MELEVSQGLELDKEQFTPENCKELYQSIVDAVKQLDLSSSNVSTVEGLFASELLSRREKLKDLCEKLIFADPKKYGVVLRDRLWKSVLYDVMTRSKRLKKGSSFTQLQQVYVKNHLLNGIGQLNILLFKIQYLPQFKKAKLRITPNGIDNIFFATFNQEPKEDTGEIEDEKLDKWLVEILYMCLINIGDLYRYLTEIFYRDNDLYLEYFEHAQDYYSQAFLLNPASGLAHNLLGNLSVKLNVGLDSSYYFLYSLCSSVAYEGAYQNLRQLLDGQLVHFATMPAVAELNAVDTFANSFLAMIYHFVCTDGTHLDNFEKSCQEAVLAFHELLNSDPSGIDKHLFFRLALTSIMTVSRLQATNSIYISASVAFASGILLNLTNQLAVILKNKCHVAVASIKKAKDPEPDDVERKSQDVIELEIKSPTPSPPKVSDSETTGGKVDKDGKRLKDKNAKSEGAVTAVGRRRKLAKRGRTLRTRRTVARIFCSSDEDENDNNGSDEEDSIGGGSSSDSDVLLTDDDGEGVCLDDENSELSDENEYAADDSDIDIDNKKEGDEDDYLYAESISSNDYYSDGSSVVKQSNGNGQVAQHGENEKVKEEQQQQIEETHLVLDVKDLVESIDQVESIIVAMIPYTRWFHTSPLIFSAFLQNCGGTFLQNLCEILNIVGTVNWNQLLETESEQCFQTHVLKNWECLLKGGEVGESKLDELFTIELAEDRSMLGLPDFAVILKNLKISHDVSAYKYNMIIIRIARILAFGHWLAANDEVSMIYSKEESIFKIQSAKNEKYYSQAKKLRQLREKLGSEGNNVSDKLKDAWRKDRRFLRKNWDGNNGRRKQFGKHQRNKPGFEDPDRHISNDDTIYVFVDLPALLYHFQIIRRLATYSKFLIMLPFSVHKTLDELKDTEEEGSKEARIAASWVERQKLTGALRTTRQNEKTHLKIDYPPSRENKACEFFDVLENCNFFRIQEDKNGRPATKFFDDIRDKYRILYLSGHLDLLKSSTRTDFDPKVVGQVCHVFVDRITTYVSHQGRKFRKKKFHG